MIILLNLFLQACSSSNKAVVLDYYDFGPQAMSYETIGYSWYEWNKHGDENKDDNVKIVVYEGSLESVKEQYKDDKFSAIDYRFITKKEACDYLGKNIAELSKEKDLEMLQRTLKDTKKKIVGL